MASSSKTNKQTKWNDDSFDVTQAPPLAKLDNEQIDSDACEKGFMPELADEEGCSAANVKLRSLGQGILRHGDTLRADVQLAEPLTASDDGSKIELGKLPWPVMDGEDLDISPVPALENDVCNDAGHWSDRPGQHPYFNVGRLAWPVDCNGEPADEVEYDASVGTYRTRKGHPVIHKPKAPSDCSFSPIWKFNNSDDGSLPVLAKDPLAVGIVNEDCCCTLNLMFNAHYTYNINRIQLPNGASEVNLAFKGFAGESGSAPRCWTFNQCELGNVEDKTFSGHSTTRISLPPKSGTTVNFWTEIGLGPGETVQPSIYNMNTKIEVCWIGGLDC